MREHEKYPPPPHNKKKKYAQKGSLEVTGGIQVGWYPGSEG